ncbi:MAG: oligopeptide/dipeptide ABC transporter ATP-binding protein [Gammaproteobacteria bacterium]|jgi:oligopeptide/dipeptide ABC transporter ATP-binding protein
MTALLELEDVQVRFRTRSTLDAMFNGIDDPFVSAVNGVSLQIGEGETYGLVGESGSGKTTLARSIIGLVKPQRGSIRYQGKELLGMPADEQQKFRRNVGAMFQDPVGSLSPRMTIRSLLAEPFKIHGMGDRDLGAEVNRLLDMVGLNKDIASRYPHQLSGGQARRVGVARALALDPKLIIADEPTAGLDVSVQGEILNLMGRLQAELGISILVITHNLNVVRHITDRMGIMYFGRILEQGPTSTIFDHPSHPYTLALLSANPEPDPDAKIDRLELEGEVPSLFNRPTGCEFHPRCPFATDICASDFPTISNLGIDHSFRCHHPRQKI